VFDIERQATVRALLLDRARADLRVTGAAVTGSAARGAADRWSDVDLFFGVDDAVEMSEVVADWTAFVCAELGAVHHFDLAADGAIYRAFLLADGLEVDLGFTPAATFGSRGDGTFAVVFGFPTARRAGWTPDPQHLIGLAWHHILHARTSIERVAFWQAEHWIAALREVTLTLGCVRLGLPPSHAKGADQLPTAEKDLLQPTLVTVLDSDELSRALQAAVEALLTEVTRTDPAARDRFGPLLVELAAVPARAPAKPPGRSVDAAAGVLVGGRERRDIVLVDHDPRWADRFEHERSRIRTALGTLAVRVEHVGSTAVPGLAAKPIVDILLTVHDVEDDGSYSPALRRAGYVLRVREPGHRMLRSPDLDVHVHVWDDDHPAAGAHLAFRDRLRAEPADRDLYAATKRRLAGQDWPTMNDYAAAKTDVIRDILTRAAG